MSVDLERNLQQKVEYVYENCPRYRHIIKGYYNSTDYITFELIDGQEAAHVISDLPVNRNYVGVSSSGVVGYFYYSGSVGGAYNYNATSLGNTGTKIEDTVEEL